MNNEVLANLFDFDNFLSSIVLDFALLLCPLSFCICLTHIVKLLVEVLKSSLTFLFNVLHRFHLPLLSVSWRKRAFKIYPFGYRLVSKSDWFTLGNWSIIAKCPLLMACLVVEKSGFSIWFLYLSFSSLNYTCKYWYYMFSIIWGMKLL